jgi:probable HAF family extracellular repeat protein
MRWTPINRWRSVIAAVGLVAGLALTVAASTPAAASPFAVTDLGTLGGTSSTAMVINGPGQVAGMIITTSGAAHTFFWSRATGMLDLGVLGTSWGSARSYPYGINDAGQVVGNSTTNSSLNHAFLWTQGDGMVDLGVLPGANPANQSWAQAMNASGEVVGYSFFDVGNFHAFRWTQATGMVDLGTLGGDASKALAVNDAGQIAGIGYTPRGYGHAFFWSAEDGMVDLGTLGGLSSSAWAINRSGQVAGVSKTASGEDHPFLWTPGGGMVDLGTLPGSTGTSVMALNDSGRVLGGMTVNGHSHGFSWTQGTGMVDLGSLGGENTNPGGLMGPFRPLNNAGQAVGVSASPSGLHAFSWTLEGGMVDLGTLGGSISRAGSVNDNGQIVGAVGTAAGYDHAALWLPSADTTPPVVTVPPNRTVEAVSGRGAALSFNATASDNIDQSLVVACSPISDAVFPLGDTTVTCTATDSSGNHGTASFVVHVVDTTPPNLTTPTDFARNATSPNGAVVTFSASASDLVDPSPLVACEPASGSGFFAIGKTSVACTATDAAGNHSSASFVVHVRGASDQTTVLITLVVATNARPGIISSLDAKLDALQRTLAVANADSHAEASNILGAFINEVQAQTGKALTTDQASQLIGAAQRIQAVLG